MAMKNYATLEEVKARVMHALTAITAKFFVPVHHERRWKRQERCKQVDASMAMREEPEKGQTHCGTKPGQFETSYHSLPHKQGGTSLVAPGHTCKNHQEAFFPSNLINNRACESRLLLKFVKLKRGPGYKDEGSICGEANRHTYPLFTIATLLSLFMHICRKCESTNLMAGDWHGARSTF